jgi:hypothetical protein
MLKYLLFVLVIISSQNISIYSQDDWKSEWLNVLSTLDSMFVREQRQFRIMQSYQNEATEDLIIKDIDSLNVFMRDVNSHIDMANKYKLPDTDEGKNATETVRLKTEALREYFEQCLLQIQVNNNILQKKLKNESLEFKVSQIKEYQVNVYTPQK